MKTHIVVAAALSAFVLSTLSAAVVAAPPAPASAPMVQRAPDPLNLTPAQQAKVADMRKEAMASLGTLQNDKSLTLQQKNTKFQSLQASMHARWLAILTPTQRKTVAKLQAQQDAMRANFTKQRNAFEATISPAQKAQLKVISDAARAQSQVIMNNKSLAQADKQKQFMALQADYRTKIQAILTPAQRATLATINSMH